MRRAAPLDRPDVVALALVAVLCAGVVAVAGALPAGVLLAGAAGVLLLGVAAAAAVRHGVEPVGFGLLALGVATSGWNAVAVGGLKVAHAALGLAAVVLGAHALLTRRPVRAPSWVWGLGGVIVLVTVLSVLWPRDPIAFAGRYTDGRATYVLTALADADLAAAAQWLVAAVAVPVVVCLAVAEHPGRLRVLVDASILGAVVNAVVALGDETGRTAISALLLPEVDIGGRQAALTVQPNHAALVMAMALPLAVWRAADTSRPAARAGSALAAAVLAGGLVTTASRAGLVAAVVGLLAVALIVPALRRRLPALGALGALAVVAVVVVAPSTLARLGERLRLVQGLSTDKSDAIRTRLAQQAVDDVLGSPWHGVGLQVGDQAHNIYLQLLAAGGVVLLVGYLAAQLGFLLEAVHLRHRERGLPLALAVSGATFLLAGAVSNQLSDVFVAVPFALVAGVWATTRPPAPGAPSGDAPVVPSLEEVRS